MKKKAIKKNEPICKDALEYVRSHVYMPVSDEEFCLIEKYVAEKHQSLFPNGHLGDGDLRKHVCTKLTEIKILIPQNKVDAIVNALYDFMFETGDLLDISLEFTLNTWYDWDDTLTDAIRSFKKEYEIYPTIVRLSKHTKSQIEYVTSISPKAKVYGETFDKFLFSDIIDDRVENCTVKFRIENTIVDKHFILQATPDDDDDDDNDNGKGEGSLTPIKPEHKSIKVKHQ